jgi:hypothetical protein
MNTKKLKAIYLDKLKSIPNKSQNIDYHIRKIRERLWEEFDSTWIKYNNGDATFQQWEKTLNKWLNAERI